MGTGFGAEEIQLSLTSCLQIRRDGDGEVSFRPQDLEAMRIVGRG